MKKFFKKVAATAVILGVIGGGVSAPTAEAFNLGQIASSLLGVAGGDINTANKRMLENFYYSTALLASAYTNVKVATDDSIANKNLITQEQAVKSAVKTSDAGLNMKNGAKQNKDDAENVKKYLSDALASGDEEKLKQIDEFIKTANNQRVLSDVMAGVSYTQIGFITAAQLKSVASGNVVEGIGNIIAIAQETDALLKIRNELSKSLKTATEEYRKARGIKDPSKKESKAAAAQIEKG
ncbi:MAG: hypothetical protein IKN16_01580 [Selenomonadaceae bacterium]|nr:hypothetical protein [Selenomonadaceae bacterium]MBR6887119.1 hypothetical protein [Selenomonadaceae bacterium]